MHESVRIHLKEKLKNFIKRKCIHTISKACLEKTEYKSKNPVLVPEKTVSKTAKLYYDTGEGFCEKNTIKSNYKMNGETVKIHFDTEGLNIKRIRFDPLDEACIVYEMIININGKEADYHPKNAKTIADCSSLSEFYLFATNDPIFIIDSEYDNYNKIEIEFNIAAGSIELIKTIIENINNNEVCNGKV